MKNKAMVVGSRGLENIGLYQGCIVEIESIGTLFQNLSIGYMGYPYVSVYIDNKSIGYLRADRFKIIKEDEVIS